MTSRPRVSAIMITGNVVSQSPGQAIFERSLASLGWCDEIIVVDSASTDATRDIAARFTARVYVHPFQNSLMLQKQIALKYVTGDWILWLDADEVLPPALIAEIQAALAHPLCNGYAIRREHFFAGAPLKFASVDCKVRLWRRGEGRWAGIPNDDYYEVDPPVGSFPTAMEHYSTPTLAARLRKMAYFSPAHAALAPLPEPGAYSRRGVWRRLIKPPLQMFYGLYWVHRGYKDGVRGLIWSVLGGINEFYIAIQIWERAQSPAAAADSPSASSAQT